MKLLAIILALTAISAGPETKPASTDILKLMEGLPKDYRPDATGNFNSYTMQKADDWMKDKCTDCIVNVPIVVDQIIGPFQNKGTGDWSIAILPAVSEQRICGARGLIKLHKESIQFQITDAQAKEASKWKSGKKLTIRGRVQRIAVGSDSENENDDARSYYPQPAEGTAFNAVYRLDLRECSYEAR